MSGEAEIVLVAEDEELVRNLAKRILEQAGYTVLAATDGAEALQLFRQNPCNSARPAGCRDAQSQRLRGLCPNPCGEPRNQDPSGVGVRTGDGPGRHGAGAELHFIAKPVDMATLLRTVREAIEEGRTRLVSG